MFQEMALKRYPSDIVQDKPTPRNQMHKVRQRAYLVGVNDCGAVMEDFAAWCSWNGWHRSGKLWFQHTIEENPPLIPFNELFNSFLNQPIQNAAVNTTK